MKNKRRVCGTSLTYPVPPRSGLVQLLSEPPEAFDKGRSAYLSDRRYSKIQIGCNIHQLT
jgi:hypothetical protein